MHREGTYQTRADALANATTARQYWLDAISAASENESEWRTKAEKTFKIYNGETRVAFNILHSNVETQKPAIFNSLPVPDVRTRNLDKNPVAQKASQVIERGLSYLLDEYDFSNEVDAAVYDLLIAGRGVAWVNYEPTMALNPAGYEQIVWQQASCERVPWDRFRHGPAMSWSRVPWVARLKYMTREDVIALAGDEAADQIQYDASLSESMTDKSDKAKREKTVWEAACVWEIWCRETRKVWYVAEGYSPGPLAMIDDPLGLGDFFPCPRPAQVLMARTDMRPVVPYSVYSDQAEELDRISKRLIALAGMVKYRGIRAAEIPELDSLETLDDGQFMPSNEAMAILQGGGALDKAIWAVPVDKIVVVMRELMLQRETIKQTIYEITGISDILRGSTNPNETLGAQQLKAQWGSLKIQTLQHEVQRFIRDLLRIKAEIIAEKFEPHVLSMIAGEQLQPDVLQVLKTDILRRFSIDIETDSTIRADVARNQGQMAQFLQATGQYLQVVAPAVQGGMLPPGPAVAIFSAFARTFKLGKQVEDELAKLSDGATQHMMQNEQKREEERQFVRSERAAEVAKKQAETQKIVSEMQVAPTGNEGLSDDAARYDLEVKRLTLEREKAVADVTLRREEMRLERELKLLELDLKARAEGTAHEAAEQAEPDRIPAADALAGLIDALRAMQGPKRVVRDSNGEIVGIEPVSEAVN